MFFISHRGNISGPNPNEENKIEYINEAINQNFDVEIDVWFKNDQFYLGHDEPQYPVNMEFLNNRKLGYILKNLDCFYKLGETNLNFFWHEEDKVVLTKRILLELPRNKTIQKKYICITRKKPILKTQNVWNLL